MKRAIASDMNQLQEKLQNSTAIMYFSYKNLCVKAEEASLLPITVEIEGEGKKLEDVATIMQKDEYRFAIVPNYDDEMVALAEGVAKMHPEFKQSRETISVDPEDGSGPRDVEYLLVTMPDVDKERRDLLKEYVDTLYDECKAKIEKAVAEAEIQLALHSEGEKPEYMDDVRKAMKENREQWQDHCKKMHEEKLKEIEDGYQRWLAGKEEKQKASQEKVESVGEAVTQRMKLTPPKA
jgi:ribosome recycling factor